METGVALWNYESVLSPGALVRDKGKGNDRTTPKNKNAVDLEDTIRRDKSPSLRRHPSFLPLSCNRLRLFKKSFSLLPLVEKRHPICNIFISMVDNTRTKKEKTGDKEDVAYDMLPLISVHPSFFLSD